MPITQAGARGGGGGGRRKGDKGKDCGVGVGGGGGVGGDCVDEENPGAYERVWGGSCCRDSGRSQVVYLENGNALGVTCSCLGRGVRGLAGWQYARIFEDFIKKNSVSTLRACGMKVLRIPLVVVEDHGGKKPAWKRICSGCSKVAAEMGKCQGCGFVWYCSKRCQKADWERHRACCKDFVRLAGEGVEMKRVEMGRRHTAASFKESVDAFMACLGGKDAFFRLVSGSSDSAFWSVVLEDDDGYGVSGAAGRAGGHFRIVAYPYDGDQATGVLTGCLHLRLQVVPWWYIVDCEEERRRGCVLFIGLTMRGFVLNMDAKGGDFGDDCVLGLLPASFNGASSWRYLDERDVPSSEPELRALVRAESGGDVGGGFGGDCGGALRDGEPSLE